jgi:hypothetical protein
MVVVTLLNAKFRLIFFTDLPGKINLRNEVLPPILVLWVEPLGLGNVG